MATDTLDSVRCRIGTITSEKMTGGVEELVLDLLEWLELEPRPYGEVMDVWRTSCPRLPVWEDAVDAGLVERRHEPGAGRFVSLSPSGRSFLRSHRTDFDSRGRVS